MVSRSSLIKPDSYIRVEFALFTRQGYYQLFCSSGFLSCLFFKKVAGKAMMQNELKGIFIRDFVPYIITPAFNLVLDV